MKDVIKVQKLSKSYGGKTAVAEVSLTVSGGMVFGLLGANGAGKSSVLECILGIKKPDSGEISILRLNPFTQRKQIFEKTGVQFQEAHYQDKITVEELCELKSAVSELSGGQRQRLFIVLALIPDPEVVFLDELTTGLDVKARREVWKILEELKNKGLTIFLTSHFMDEVEVLCDQICILKKGKAVFYGTVSEAIRQSPYEKLEDAYLWFAGEEGETNEDF